ncbi:hypothetical protein [Aliikangiella sp. IMCC44632]
MKNSLIILILFLSLDTLACSISISSNYEALLLDPGYRLSRKPKLPEITVKAIGRGIKTDVCPPPIGSITFKVENNKANIGAGYKFELHEGKLPLLGFPEEPVRSKFGDTISFSWIEQVSDIDKPINAVVKITAVLPNFEESTPVYVKIGH